MTRTLTPEQRRQLIDSIREAYEQEFDSQINRAMERLGFEEPLTDDEYNEVMDETLTFG